MDDDLESHQMINFQVIKGKFAPSLSTDYHINFNFTFELRISEFVLNQDSAALMRQSDESISDSACVAFQIHPNLSIRKTAELFAVDTREAINTILTCLPLSVSDDGRRELIDFAIGEAHLAVRNSMHSGFEAVDLYILVQVEDRRVFDLAQETIEYSCAVPATESSVELLLKKHKDEDVDSGNINREISCCCICFQDFSSSGEEGSGEEELLWMPCDHVFHRDCIKKWLSTSHYCPLCRFEMPTAKRS